MKGRWMPKVLVALMLATGGVARAQDPPPPADVPPPAAEPAEEGDRPLGEEEAMVLNFERADIRDVIHSLATALGLSYTIDPRIEGQITLRTIGRIPREDLFPLLNQILRNNGIAGVKVGDIYQFLPVAEAKTRAIIPRTAVVRQRVRETDAFVIEIIPVEHVSADEMVNILQPFVTPGGDVLSYPRANLLVVTDLQSNVERLRELVATFDSDIFRNLRTRVFKIEHGDPTELADEILGLLAPYGVGPGAEGESGIYMVPLTRLNSLVVVAFDRSVFEEVARWLRLLDIPPDEGAGRQTFVYNVENTKAVDLAAVLNELFGGGPGGGGVGGVGARVPGAPPAGVGLFGAGGASGGRAAGGRIGGGGRGGLGGGGGGAAFGQQQVGMAQQQVGGVGGGVGGTRAGRLGGGRAGGLGAGAAPGVAGAPGAAAAGAARGITFPGRTAVAGAPGQPAGPPPIFREEVRIVADEVTNSLVILATKRDYQLILDVLKKIDVVPRQVLLEVTIAEVLLGEDLRFGVEWALAEGKLGLNNLPQSNENSVFRTGPTGLPVGGLITGVQRVPIAGGFAVISDRENFNLFINALATRTNVKMLSAPHIIAADNREAHILVGESIPILTSTQTSTIGAANIVNSVQYRDTGKILTILPQVNSKGLVNMQIRQEVSAVAQDSFGQTQSPSFSTREAETTVVVNNGETVIIGGIMDDAIRHGRVGIPYVMNIPVLGRFFRVDTDRVDRTELIILISPYVIRDREEARDVTDEFSRRISGLRQLGERMRERHERLAERRGRREAEGEDGAGAPPARDVVPREAVP